MFGGGQRTSAQDSDLETRIQDLEKSLKSERASWESAVKDMAKEADDAKAALMTSVKGVLTTKLSRSDMRKVWKEVEKLFKKRSFSKSFKEMATKLAEKHKAAEPTRAVAAGPKANDKWKDKESETNKTLNETSSDKKDSSTNSVLTHDDPDSPLPPGLGLSRGKSVDLDLDAERKVSEDDGNPSPKDSADHPFSSTLLHANFTTRILEDQETDHDFPIGSLDSMPTTESDTSPEKKPPSKKTFRATTLGTADFAAFKASGLPLFSSSIQEDNPITTQDSETPKSEVHSPPSDGGLFARLNTARLIATQSVRSNKALCGGIQRQQTARLKERQVYGYDGGKPLQRAATSKRLAGKNSRIVGKNKIGAKKGGHQRAATETGSLKRRRAGK